MTTVQQHCEEIARFSRQLHQAGFVAATDGNLSVRLDNERVLSTPTAMSKGSLSADDIVTVDMDGQLISGRHNVTSEIAMHLMIYKLRPDVRGIVHAHPVTATGFATAGLALNQPLVSEVVMRLGSIPLAKYGTPGTPELCKSLEPLVLNHNAILMANHGAVAFAETLEGAYMNMEMIEHFAKIALVTHLLGHQQPLGDEEVRKLLLAGARYKSLRNTEPLTSFAMSTNGQ
jgi:L-fuculose-phosphate aldolase